MWALPTWEYLGVLPTWEDKGLVLHMILLHFHQISKWSLDIRLLVKCSVSEIVYKGDLEGKCKLECHRNIGTT